MTRMAKRTSNTSQTSAKSRWQKLASIATAVIVLGSIVGLVASRDALVQRAALMHEASEGGAEVPPPRVDIDWPLIEGRIGPSGEAVSWMSESLRAQLSELVRSELTNDPMDHKSLKRAADRLIATGWIRELHEMTRVTDPAAPGGAGSVNVRGEWRAPVALVRWQERDHLVAAGGELLPISYPAGSVGTLKVITGAFGPPPDVYGEPWSGGDVQAALGLLAYLQPTVAFSQVSGVDVAGYVKHKRLVIVTDQNTRVVWGSAPGEWKPGEPSTQQKISWLVGLRRDAKHAYRIDAGRAQVDLTVAYGVFSEVTQQGPQDAPPGVEPESVKKRQQARARE